MYRTIFLLITVVFGHGVCDVANVEVPEEVLKELHHDEQQPDSCPIRKCPHTCPLGRRRDKNDCLTCECKSNGRFEGDIIVTDSDYWMIDERYSDHSDNVRSRQKRGAMYRQQSEWPRVGDNVHIPYIMENTITGMKRKRIMEAIEEFNKRTCIRFTPRKGENDYVEFSGLGSCSSNLGRKGGKQTISIGQNCESRLGTVLHEMMHAVGFWHEQSRGDRDYYITVKWANILPEARKYFKRQTRFWNSYGSPYDVNSLMHYGGDFFASQPDVPTIIDKKTGKMLEAQRQNFSPEDVIQINTKYQCSKYVTKDQGTRSDPKVKEVCKDNMKTSLCELYTKRNYCQFSNFQKKCMLTCQACTPEISTIITVVPVKIEKEEVKCEDKRKKCPQFKSRGFCEISKRAMGKFCPKTCGFCTVCEDNKSRCKIWASKGKCDRGPHRLLIRKTCQKSCGIC